MVTMMMTIAMMAGTGEGRTASSGRTGSNRGRDPDERGESNIPTGWSIAISVVAFLILLAVVVYFRMWRVCSCSSTRNLFRYSPSRHESSRPLEDLYDRVFAGEEGGEVRRAFCSGEWAGNSTSYTLQGPAASRAVLEFHPDGTLTGEGEDGDGEFLILPGQGWYSDEMRRIAFRASYRSSKRDFIGRAGPPRSSPGSRIEINGTWSSYAVGSFIPTGRFTWSVAPPDAWFDPENQTFIAAPHNPSSSHSDSHHDGDGDGGEGRRRRRRRRRAQHGLESGWDPSLPPPPGTPPPMVFTPQDRGSQRSAFPAFAPSDEEVDYDYNAYEYDDGTLQSVEMVVDDDLPDDELLPTYSQSVRV